MKFTHRLEEQTIPPNGTKIWKLKVTVCNETDQEVTGAVAENPWRAPQNTEKMEYDKDAQGKPVEGSDAKHAKQRAKKVTLSPKGQPGDCVTVEFVYDVKPGMAYTDFYLYKPDGITLEDQWKWGTVENLTPIKVGMLIPPNGCTYALAFPTPFQMSLDEIHRGDIWLQMDPASELPDGFEYEHVFPGFSTSFRVSYLDRQSQGAIVLRQFGELPAETAYTIAFTQRLVRPRELRIWPARSIQFTLTNDVIPPELTLSKIHVSTDWLELEVEARDSCSGVAGADLVAIGSEGDQIDCIFESKQIESVADDTLRYSFKVPWAFIERSGGLVARAFDMVGNQSSLAIPALTADSIDGAERTEHTIRQTRRRRG